VSHGSIVSIVTGYGLDHLEVGTKILTSYHPGQGLGSTLLNNGYMRYFPGAKGAGA
jgi:hypothetical protein